MDTIEKNPLEFIGANGPPEPTPYEASLKEIDDLYDECELWLDGAAIDSQPLADGIANLMTLLRAAIKKAEAARKAEKDPLDEQVDEIQARYNLLIGKTKTVKGRAVQALEALADTLQPWLDAERRRIDEEARLAREAAEEAALAALVAVRNADRANLVERAQAEQLVVEAKEAAAFASKTGRQTATAGGAMGRSIHLKTVWTATMTDSQKAGKWAWTHHKGEILGFISDLAQADVTAGKREIDGFEITSEQRAV